MIGTSLPQRQKILYQILSTSEAHDSVPEILPVTPENVKAASTSTIETPQQSEFIVRLVSSDDKGPLDASTA